VNRNQVLDKIEVFVGEHFALVVAGVLVLVFAPMAFIGLSPPPPPPPPPQVVTLTAKDRKLIAQEVLLEIGKLADAGRDAR
jgi:hypothetical protein